MGLRNACTGSRAYLLILALMMAGCQSAQPQSPAVDQVATQAAERAKEAREIADAMLGKQSEILAQGNLAQNGQEQLLVVNRVSRESQSPTGGIPSSTPITRAAIYEKDGDKWSEVLRCDEHLKNPSGYLGGAPGDRVSGWRLEFSRDAESGLEMKFTPMEGAGNLPKGPSVVVRWNKAAKRYQSFDRSRMKYLADISALEAEPSHLR